MSRPKVLIRSKFCVPELEGTDSTISVTRYQDKNGSVVIIFGHEIRGERLKKLRVARKDTQLKKPGLRKRQYFRGTRQSDTRTTTTFRGQRQYTGIRISTISAKALHHALSDVLRLPTK